MVKVDNDSRRLIAAADTCGTVVFQEGNIAVAMPADELSMVLLDPQSVRRVVLS